MRISPADIAIAFATPIGRRWLSRGLAYRSWFLLRRFAGLYRRTALRHTELVVVIGSFGKTTVTRSVGAALGLPERSNGRNAYQDLAFNLLRIPPGARHGVVEVGINRPGQMRPYADMLRPNVVVVTSIGSEHRRSLGDLAATRREKATMLEGLGPGNLVVGASDDPNVEWMLRQTRARTVRFGRTERADVQLLASSLEWPHGSRLQVRIGSESRELRSRLLGRPGENAMLAALAVASELGVPIAWAVERLERLAPTASRLQPQPLPGGARLLADEFKAAPETMDAALDVLAAIPAARKQIVLGEISEPPPPQWPFYHRIGQRAGAVAERLIVLGGRKAWSRYRAGALVSRPTCEVLHAEGSPREAVRLLQLDLQPGDVVLVKGRDTQKLARVVLRLRDEAVDCDVPTCPFTIPCTICPALTSPVSPRKSRSTARALRWLRGRRW